MSIKILKRNFLLALLFFFAFYLTFANFIEARHGDRIVPACNITNFGVGGLENPCNICHFIQLIQNVLNFTWWHLVPFIAVFMLIWGGGLLMISSARGDEGSLSKAKKILLNTVTGIALVFFSWIIIDTVIKIVGGKIVSGEGVIRRDSFLPWNKIECVAPAQPQPPAGGPGQPGQPPTGPGAGQPPGSGFTPTGALAQVLNHVDNNRILFRSTPSCSDTSGTPVGVETNYNELRGGEALTVCQSGCTLASRQCQKNSGVALDSRLLGILAETGGINSFTITSLTTGSHSSGSLHYQGKAVDVVPRGGTSAGAMQGLFSTLNDPERKRRFGVRNVFCEAKEVVPACNNSRVCSDCTQIPAGKHSHIHIEWQ